MSHHDASPSRDEVITLLRAAGCVFAEDEARIITDAAGSPAELAALLARRIAGEPLEQVVGWAEFLGRRILLEPGVFVPRRRTEFLATRALDLARQAVERLGKAVVLDLCCGSGALATTLAASVEDIEVYAADLDPAAVRCARRNLTAVTGSGHDDHVYQGDLYDALPASARGTIDVLVANVPYVPTREIALLPAEAREHEPPLALDGGRDGLDVLRRVTAEAPNWLAPGGLLLIEASQRQVTLALAAFTAAGMSPHAEFHEDLDTTIIVGATTAKPRPASAGDPTSQHADTLVD